MIFRIIYFFCDFVTDRNVNFTALKFEGKYVGIVGV